MIKRFETNTHLLVHSIDFSYRPIILPDEGLLANEEIVVRRFDHDHSMLRFVSFTLTNTYNKI